MMAVLVMAMIINFVVNPAFSLMPLLVTEHFNGGALHLGWLESSWGIGMVLGGLLLSVWGGFRRRVYTSLAGLVLGGTGVMLIGLLCGTVGCKDRQFEETRKKAGAAVDAARRATTQAVEDAKPLVDDAGERAAKELEKLRTATTQAVDKAKTATTQAAEKARAATTQAAAKAKPLVDKAKRATTRAAEDIKDKLAPPSD